jgi:Sec7-like guanine-nucleotide exchange factor
MRSVPATVSLDLLSFKHVCITIYYFTWIRVIETFSTSKVLSSVRPSVSVYNAIHCVFSLLRPRSDIILFTGIESEYYLYNTCPH